MDPNLFPYNNMTANELREQAEREGNKLALALHHLLSEQIADAAPAECDDCDEMRSVLQEVENDEGFDGLSLYTRQQVEANT